MNVVFQQNETSFHTAEVTMHVLADFCGKQTILFENNGDNAKSNVVPYGETQEQNNQLYC